MRRSPHPRSFLRIVAVICLAFSIAAPGVAGAAGGFGDVPEGEYYTDAVAWMVGADITTGIDDGCFGPDLDVTRGQVAAFLHRLDASLGNVPASADHPFLDVRAPYQQEPVGWLYDEGLTTGIAPGRFAPGRSITRGDFAVLLWRYAGSPNPDGALPFLDVTKSYQRTAITWMAERGVTTGTSALTFDPSGHVSRAQAAAFLHRFVDPDEAATHTTSEPCTRPLRAALMAGGLTPGEAVCAAPWLGGFDVAYLVEVVGDRTPASFELIVAAATIGAECLAPDRVADLSRLFL